MTQIERRLDPRFKKPKRRDVKVKIDDRFKKFSEWDESEASKLEKYYYLKDNDASKSEASSSSEDDSSSSHTEETIPIMTEFINEEHALVDHDVIDGDATHRLAVVNLDWDQIKAVDIFSVANGFKPNFGFIKSVKIYPSDFGEKKMAEEIINGPSLEVPKEKEEEKSHQELKESPVDDQNNFDDIKLREYQLNRLKYYFAVIECDSIETAKMIYESCDGLEFERSCNFLDMRYIPNDMEFEEAKIKDAATEAPQNYVPLEDIMVDALGRSKPSLSWDADDPVRIKLTGGKIDPELVDLHTYLASNSDTDTDVDNSAQKYKKLLEEESSCGDNVFGKRNPKSQIDIDFVNSLVNSQSDIDMEEEFFVKKEANSSEEEEESAATFQRQPRKEKKSKEKGQKKRIMEENSLIMADKDYKKKKLSSKKYSKDSKDRPFDIKTDDSRFEALYQNADYAVDPSNPMFKPGMEKIVKERHRRRPTHYE